LADGILGSLAPLVAKHGKDVAMKIAPIAWEHIKNSDAFKKMKNKA